MIENETKISERSKGRIFLGSKLFESKHLGKDRNLAQPEKLSLIARLLEIIPCYTIIRFTLIYNKLYLDSTTLSSVLLATTENRLTRSFSNIDML